MAKGLFIPVKVNKKGGAYLIKGTPYTEQTIMVGLTPNLSKNPFQAGDGVEIGLSERIIFAVNNVSAQSLVRRQIVRNFSRWKSQEIAKLAPPGSNGLSFKQEDEELIAEIKYIELEADKQEQLVTNFKDTYSGSKLNYSGK